MKLFESLYKGDLLIVEEIIKNKLDEKIHSLINDEKIVIASSLLSEKIINRINMGRYAKIKKRIRRDKHGKIIVQTNIKRSLQKGYRISGNRIKRMDAVKLLHRRQELKRAWRTGRRSKLRQALIKRKLSLRRRKAMGL